MPVEVQVAATALAIEPHRLSAGFRQARPPTGSRGIDLAQCLSTTGDVAEREGDETAATEVDRASRGRLEVTDPNEPLLDAGRKHSHGGPVGSQPAAGLQQGRFDPNPGWLPDGMHVDGAACPVHFDAIAI